MHLPLLMGSFSPSELDQLLTGFIQAKIKYHEEKIKHAEEAETIKMRENRIIKLQNDLAAVRNQLKQTNARVNAKAIIHLSLNHG